GQFSPGASNAMAWNAPTSITLTNGLAQTLTSGNLSITTPTLIGQDGGSATVATSGGTISVSNAGGLTFQSVTAGQPTVMNLNGGPLNISGSSVTVGSSVTLSSDNNITFTASQLSLGSLSTIITSGASVPAGAFPWIYVTSPAGTGLTVVVPSGSSALIQTNGYPSKCAGHPGCNNQTISGLIMQGGIAFAPPSGQTLQVLDSGASPTTPQSNGMLVTGTVNASTTIGSSVTLFSNGAPTSLMVQNNSLFLNGAISSNYSIVGGFNNWRVIQIGGSGGTLTIDRNDFSDPNGGTINATGIPSTTIPDAPGGPGVFIGNGATSLTFNQS